MRWVMAEYYSSKLREIAKLLKENGDPVNSIHARIIEGSADRIDDLQKELGSRIIQIAGMQDKIDTTKKPLSEEDKEWIDQEAGKKYMEWSRQGVRGQIIYEQDGFDYWIMLATHERLKNR